MFDPENITNPESDNKLNIASENDEIKTIDEEAVAPCAVNEDSDEQPSENNDSYQPVEKIIQDANEAECNSSSEIGNIDDFEKADEQSEASEQNADNYNNHYSYTQPQQGTHSYQQYNEAQPVKKSKGKVAFLAIACVLLVFAVGVFAIVLTGGFSENSNSNGLKDVPFVSPVSSADYDGEGLSSAEVYQKVFKSSVTVLAYRESTGALGILGSGIIFREDENNTYTYIVTCAHVINDPDYNIKVELWDGSVHTAEVVNYDDTNDIGVIRIRANGLQLAEFGDSDELQPGATVYAIGTPYSSKFAGSFTRGMVSAVNRLVTTHTSYQLSCIQHDAAINHGNSGGALLNVYGQIVGINALKITADGYIGLGFAVPSATVIKVINSILETGMAPKTPKLGVTYVQAIYYSQFLSDLVEKENLPAGSIVIADINKDSDLYDSEIQVNDIITAVNGQNLTSPDMLVQMIQNSNVGDSLELNVVRIIMNEDGTDYVDIKSFTVTAVLVENKDNESEDQKSEEQEDFYQYFGEDSGSYEDFYEYFYDYFYNGENSEGNNDESQDDNHFTIPE